MCINVHFYDIHYKIVPTPLRSHLMDGDEAVKDGIVLTWKWVNNHKGFYMA